MQHLNTSSSNSTTLSTENLAASMILGLCRLHLNTSSSNSTTWDMGNLAPSMVLGLCCLVGVPGNLVVAYAISRHPRRASLTVKLMLNLALTDILSLLMVPLWIAALLGGWRYGHATCKVLSYVVYCGLYASVLTVTLMSIQRYLLVLYPSCRAKLSPRGRGARVLLASLWALACLLASPVAVLRDLQEVETGGGRLACRPHYGSTQVEVAILLLETLLGFVVPGATLTTSYLCIVWRVGRLTSTSGRRLGRLVTWVVGAFFLFWAPWHILNLAQAAAALAGEEPGAGLREAVRRGQNVAGALTFLNSCLNPFLYAFASRKLRGTSSLMKRLERMCHSRVPNVPDVPNAHCKMASLCTPPPNVTLTMTTQLGAGATSTNARGCHCCPEGAEKEESGVFSPATTGQGLGTIHPAPKFQIATTTDACCQQGPEDSRTLRQSVTLRTPAFQETRLAWRTRRAVLW
ncbi:hypothetical protein AAFF_G00227760 [Aldrovandia affinis]|uniref:G-protein coupled receptors family 1 profile domain-containing protein n=1 Tax=Aldrovandia affinis TaxID=143900 RepID=A0AAD7TCU5_9TELE|nr:hypothetical protein AAFF_G00227760 [Aldrovandia affinis]